MAKREINTTTTTKKEKPENSTSRSLKEDLAGLTPNQKLIKFLSLVECTNGTYINYKGATYKYTVDEGITDFIFDVDKNIIYVPASVFDNDATSVVFFELFKALAEMLMRKGLLKTPSKNSENTLKSEYEYMIQLTAIDRINILREMDKAAFAFMMQAYSPNVDAYVKVMSRDDFIKSNNGLEEEEVNAAYYKYEMQIKLIRKAMSAASYTAEDDPDHVKAPKNVSGYNTPKTEDPYETLCDEIIDKLDIMNRRGNFTEQVRYICDVILNRKMGRVFSKKVITERDDKVTYEPIYDKQGIDTGETKRIVSHGVKKITKEIKDVDKIRMFDNYTEAAKFLFNEVQLFEKEVLKSKSEPHYYRIEAILNYMRNVPTTCLPITKEDVIKVINDMERKVERDVKNSIDAGQLLSYNDKVRLETRRRFEEFVSDRGYGHRYTCMAVEPENFNPMSFYKRVNGEYVPGESGEQWAAGTWYIKHVLKYDKINEFPDIKEAFEKHLKVDPIVISTTPTPVPPKERMDSQIRINGMILGKW